MVVTASLHRTFMEGRLCKRGMPVRPLSEGEVPFYTRILADSDMDGLFGAAVLKAYRPEAEVHFTHAAAMRSLHAAVPRTHRRRCSCRGRR